MIWESWPWKAEVARLAKRLKMRKSQKRWTEATGARVEQEVFYLAYAIRKLLEAKKLSDELEAHPVKVVQHPPTGRAVDFMNWHKIDELYDLSKQTNKTLSVRDWCNQVIHSFIFIVSCDDNSAGLAGLFLSSDRQRTKGVFYVSVDEILALANAVVHDDIVHMEIKRATGGENCWKWL